MRALCIGRHPFLSEHLGRFFEKLGVDCTPCVGLREAAEYAPSTDPDLVICEYDLLASMSLDTWDNDPVLGRIPVVAVSLTRHPGEAHLMDASGISGFLYLPTLQADDAQRVLGAACRKRVPINPPNVLSWPAAIPSTQLR